MLDVPKMMQSWTTSDGKVHTDYLQSMKHEMKLWLEKASGSDPIAKSIVTALDTNTTGLLITCLEGIHKEQLRLDAIRKEDQEAQRKVEEEARTLREEADPNLLAERLHGEDADSWIDGMFERNILAGDLMEHTLGAIGKTIEEKAALCNIPLDKLCSMIGNNEPVDMEAAISFHYVFGGASPRVLVRLSDRYFNHLTEMRAGSITKDLKPYSESESEDEISQPLPQAA